MQHIITSAEHIDGRLRSARLGFTFDRTVNQFTHLLQTVHDGDGRTNRVDLEALGAIAERVIQLIETRLDRCHDRQSVQRHLAAAVYTIRREVERIQLPSKEVSWRGI